MGGLLRNRRLPAAAFVLLCVAPLGAEAPQFVCRPIVRGDTLSGLARELTGRSGAVYSPAFQIRDPARQMFLPKSQYRRPLRTDWEACVAIGRVTVPLASAPVVTEAAFVVAPPELTITSTALPALPMSSTLAVTSPPRVLTSSDGAPRGFVLMVTIGAAVIVMLWLSVAVGGWLTPRPIPTDLQRAGDQFVMAFARPLIDSSAGVPPIHVRMRFRHRAQQLEISITPGAGRRYPNLVDHKSNLEYDVTRVMRVLGPRVVMGDRLRAAGKWVVVPIRLADLNQTGAK